MPKLRIPPDRGAGSRPRPAGVLAALLAVIAVGAPAEAETRIDFDAFETTGTGFVIHPDPLDLGDYRFASVDYSSTPLLTTFQQDSAFYNGSAALSSGNSSNIVLTRIDGAAFELVSVDLDSWPGGDTIEVTGQLAGGGSVQQQFTTDLAPGGETLVLSGFVGVGSVRFDAAGATPFAGIFGQIDDLVLTAVELRDAEIVAGGSPVLQNGTGTVRLEDPRLGRVGSSVLVPEPGAPWLLGSGCALLTLLAGRHRRARPRPAASERASEKGRLR